MERTENNPAEYARERSLQAIGWPALLAELASRASGEPGKKLCKDPPLYESAPACEIALAETGEMIGLFEKGSAPPPAPVADIKPLVESARSGGAMDPLDMVKALDLLAYSEDVKRALGVAPPGSRLGQWGARLDPAANLRKALERSVDRDGSILDSASPELKALRSRQRVLSERIHKRLSEIVARESEAVLQDSFYTQRGHRYVVPVKAAARGRFEGIVHDASQSGQTVFVEPTELVEPNNQLRLIASAIDEEILRVVRELSDRIGAAADVIVTNQNVLAHLDAVRARARLSLDLEAEKPEINERDVIRVGSGRHPLLALRGVDVVPNDIEMEEGERVLVISGPNTGGKTVCLTMAGLFVLMTRAGLFVPANPGSEVPLHLDVFAVIGDEQDLAQDLSSFSAHIKDLRAIAELAGPRSLVLLDELMSSTDPEEGSALGIAVLSALYERGATVMATTHFPQLKTFAHERKGFVNASFAFDTRALRPTYNLVMGIPGRSMGIEIASRLGLDAGIVEQARAQMDDSSLRMESILAELSERLREAEEESAAISRERRELEDLIAEYQTVLEQARDRERQVRREARDTVRGLVRDFELEIERLKKETKKVGGADKAAEAKSSLKGLKGRAEARFGEDETGGAVDWDHASGGERVLVLPLNIEGEIVEAPKGEVKPRTKIKIRMGKRKIMVEAERLRRLPHSAQKNSEDILGEARAKARRKKPPKKPGKITVEAARPAPAASAEGPLLPQSRRNTLDLRGMRYHEAEARVEAFLDKSAGEELQNVFIIHGHGTGALKKMVREVLALSPYVRDFRPGERGEGGDGVTMAELI